MRKSKLLYGLVSVLAVLGTISCAGEDDIDRTQANRMPKSLFQGTWYVRSTIIGVPGTSAASFVGYTGPMEKIRWEIQEDYLIAYRAYEEVPGTTKVPSPDGTDDPSKYKENPVAVFPIKAHFDIKRDYNAATGEQTNVIVENTTDRPWHEREFIRVDWAASKVDAQSFSGATGNSQYNAVYFVQAHEESPDAMRVEDKEGKPVDFEKLQTISDHPGKDWSQDVHYFDMVGRFMLEPEKVRYQYTDGTEDNIPLCYFIRYNGQNYQTVSCGPTEVKVRTAFMKAGERNYEPVYLPDREMGKFGYFRTERFVWDEKYGFTESGRIYLANLHNIWEAAYETNEDGTIKTDKDGNKTLIPIEKRIPKPIVYHLNEDFPCELVHVGQEIAESWNIAFRRAVAVAKGLLTETKGEDVKELAELPTTPEEAQKKGKQPWEYVPAKMFKINTNGWVQKVEGDDWSCDNLEYDRSKQVFRLGDLRYNTMAWIDHRQISGPLGYGPSSADPETGEIVSGMAHIYGSALDEYAGRALEIVRMLNNDLTIDDLMTGDHVKDYIDKHKQVIDPAKIPQEAKALKGKQIKEAFLTEKVKSKLDAIRKNGLEPLKAAGMARRLELLKGTKLEDYLVNEEIIKVMAPHLLQGQPFGPNSNLPEQVREMLSPLSWDSTDAKALNKMRRDRAAKQTIFLAEFADDSIQGLAKDIWKKYGASRDYDKMWEILRERIFRGVTEHEVGHTVGLRHNFAGSFDSMNYFNRYWELREKPDAQGNGGLKVRDPMKVTESLSFDELYSQAKLTQAQLDGRMREYQYSSIMDYGAKFNSDVQGIGKWDEAAILFGYTGYVEVFDKASDSVKIVLRQRYSDCTPAYESIPNIAYSPVLEQWHYSSIWNLLGRTKGLVTRRFRPWAEVKKEQDEATEGCKKFIEDSKGTVQDYNQKHDGGRDLEVPYMFCSDEFPGSTVSCQRWDMGADPMEQVDNVVDSYWGYYFFNNYARDRFAFDAYNLYSRLSSRYFYYLTNVYQHWLFRVGFYGLDDITLENYWTVGTWKGFNLLLDVVRMPEYGTFCKINDNYECDAGGNRWALVSTSTDPTDEPNRIVVKRGDGRRRYSRYDYESGYYYMNRTKESGHFWDYLAALGALTASSGVFVGVEISSDFTRYLVPYYIVFEDELTKVFESVITENYLSYAPRINGGNEIVKAPLAPLALTNGMKLDPFTGQEVPDVAPLPVIDLNNWFTLKFYTLANGMAEFRSLYSLTYADRQMIYKLGSGEEVTPAAGMELKTCENPLTGHVYAAIRDPTTNPGEESGAVQMITKCEELAQKYQTQPTSRALSDLSAHIEWLDFMRGLYNVYGNNVD